MKPLLLVVDEPSSRENTNRSVHSTHTSHHAGKAGFDEIQKAIKEKDGRVIFTYWNDGIEHLREHRPFESTIMEKNWKVINGDEKRWKIFTLDSIHGSKWNAYDIIMYANEEYGIIDFQLMTLTDLAEKNIGDPKKTVQYYSDLVRLSFLEAFGGTWMDLSLILVDSLDNMFYRQMQAQEHKTLAGYILSLHGSRKHGYLDGLENWFLMAKKGSKPLREWRKNTWKFIQDSPSRSAQPGTIHILDRPMFRIDSTTANKNDTSSNAQQHREMMKIVRASVKRQTARHRNYLWGYNTWKRTIIEHPEWKNELLFKEAGAEKFGPLGHEHIFAHIPNRDLSGLSAMMGENREKIARRAKAKAAGDPYYAGFQAIKFPSLICGFRRMVADDASGKLKYTHDSYQNNSLITDLTEAGIKSAQVRAPFYDDSKLMEESLLAKRAIVKGRFKDMPGGPIFQYGYRFLVLSEFLLDRKDNRQGKRRDRRARKLFHENKSSTCTYADSYSETSSQDCLSLVGKTDPTTKVNHQRWEKRVVVVEICK